ncbi:MAG TPA: GDYXXLXY domain-containing protein [Nocardioides sp.]|uniref:GDYXXLXY domain-containing protein n=1 Tax=Nocardioides sp. TaxID=35761 RepID=UPI002E31F5C0|nr:GDYXXLXY domain-containing protein [Nocardioides sp.]HEX5089381.1 GDYXXLXY domain-containing protein [Nocardioides sp.]
MTTVAVVAALQLVLVGVAVAPRLSAYVRGDEYRMRVAPVDPVDPFRGAYVALSYPDLRPDEGRSGNLPEEGTTFVPLERDGDYWVAAGYEVERPAEGPYLACDSDGWDLSCGIESWFTSQADARRLQAAVIDGAVATVRVDDRGNAVIVDLSPEGG